MDRQKEIFEEYLRANGIKSFVRGGKMHFFFSPKNILTEDELKKTSDYAGFSDGFEGKNNLYLEKKGGTYNGHSYDEVASLYRLVKNSSKKDIKSTLIMDHLNANPELSGFVYAVGYLEQYDKGAQAKSADILGLGRIKIKAL